MQIGPKAALRDFGVARGSGAVDVNRRAFLKNGMIAAGGAVAGGVLAGGAKPIEPAPERSGTTLPVLQADGTVGSVAAGAVQRRMPPAGDATGREGVAGRRWVMVIDLAKCDGCGHCTMGCGAMHFIPKDRWWIPVLVLRDAPTEAPYYFPRPCFHCDVPPCTKVCPVNATYKTQDGTVLVDNERCIGCRFCMAACPYGVRSFNWGVPANAAEAKARGYSPEWGYPRKVGTVEKCDFCPDHAAAGELPACDKNCPMGAIYFGDQNEDAVTNSAGETLRLSKLLRDRAGYRHLESLGTEPRCYYLPPVHRQYPAPDQAAKEVGK